jgi:hypothetical protein
MMSRLSNFINFNRLSKLILLIFFAFALSFFYFFSFLGIENYSIYKSIFTGIYLIVLFSVLIYYLFYHFAFPSLKRNGYSSRIQRGLLAGMILAGFFLFHTIPLQMPHFPVKQTLEIAATGLKNPQSQGSEIRIVGLYNANGTAIDFSQFHKAGDWAIVDGQLMSSSKTNSTLEFIQTENYDLKLVLIAHPWSGIVKVTWDGESQTIDLYENPGTPRQILLKYRSSDSLYLSWAFQISACVSIGFLLFLFICTLLKIDGKLSSNSRLNKKRWLVYALPLFLGYFFYLLIYWPGLMSPDSLDQWNQLSTGVFSDWHPAFHTFFEWVLTRLWDSPASIAVFQILVMGSLIGWGLAEFEKVGTPKWANWLTVGLFLVLPDFPVMTVTLWKDVPYSLAILFLSILALKIIFSNGKWLEGKFAWIVVGIAAALVALFRHNGPPVAFGFIILAIAFYPSFWKRWAGALVLGIGIWLLVNGPIYSIVGVTKVHEDIIPAISIFGIEAHVNQDASVLDKMEFNYLKSILPASEWNNYSCSWAIAIAFNPQLSKASYDLYKARLLSTFLQLTREHPKTTINHLLCATSYIWRVTATTDGYYGSMDGENEGSTSWIKNYVRDHGYNPVYFINTYHTAIFPQFNDFINNKYRPFIGTITQDILARPAIYLYLMLFAIFINAFRIKSLSVLLVGIPSMIQTVVMLAVAMTPELRYQYAIVLVGTLIFLPLLTMNPRQYTDIQPRDII